ncbi:hypothetical protein WKW50_24345 [Ochrobactrum sp. GPK 3]|uniref:hypothetical protein n=1 Tax=Brucella sp. 22210 TaxID=3453892 RepID=UPI0031385488
MKWNKVFIILSDVDNEYLVEAADYYKRRYSVPNECCFANKSEKGYNELKCCILKGSCDFDTKLIIVCNGTKDSKIAMDSFYCNGYEFAHYLKRLGIRSVGLVAFKCSNSGSFGFLENFISACNGLYMNIGWAIGYIGDVSLFFGYEIVNIKGFWEFGSIIDLTSRLCGKLSDSKRIHLVEGNSCVIIPGSRRYGYSSIQKEK